MPFAVSGPPLVRMSVYSPRGALLFLDVSSDLAGGDITYEDMPTGCASGQITVGLTWEQVVADGYYSARNILEISSGDDCLQTACLAGATKLYVTSTMGYDTSQGNDVGQIAMWDGATLTMLIPVTGVGSDGGGQYITIGAPAAAYSNPTTLPAYGSGTIIYRRRYTGIIMRRQLVSSREPITLISMTGLTKRMSECVVTFALKSSTVDMGQAIFTLLSNFSDNFPELNISSANFGLTGQTTFDSSYVSVQMSSVISDLLNAAGSAGDVFTLRIGHDWTPRLVHLYQRTGNSYAYNVALVQGTQYFEARMVGTADQDASQLYNTVEITGDTDPVTNNAVSAIVKDLESVALYGEINATPIPNTACKTVAQCSVYAQSLLNQQAAPRANAQVTVSTRNDVYVSGAPFGLSRGDVVLGVHNVLVTGVSTTIGVLPPPTIYGLVTSAVTTLSPGGDMSQSVRFSAIEPDWNDDIAEHANALANALLQNVVTPVALAQYFVGTGAFLYIFSGLTVITPTFGAIFALGSDVVACGGSTISLPANSTTWVWLSSSASWITQTAPTTQAGCILYAIFTTNATDVIGSINKAATGMVDIPVSALPSMGDQQSPVLSNVSAVAYPVVGNGTYDAQVSFTVDVVSATWLVGLALFALPAGSTEDPHFYPKGTQSSFGIISGNWIVTWKAIGAGNSEDLYVAYEDGQGRFSGAVYVATTIANPAGTTAFGYVGTAAPNPTLLPDGYPTPFTYAVNGGGTYDADFVIHLDANGTTSNNALAEIEIVISPASRALALNSNGWTSVGQPVAKNSTGTYHCTAGGMGVQVSYSVGVRYVGHTGDRSYVYIIGPTTAAQLAQVPFTGVTVDPTTGYIVISDANQYPTSLQYSLPAAGIGSMISASWNVMTQSTSGSADIWLMYQAGSQGYMLEWTSAGFLTISELATATYTVLATSTISYARDTTTFHNLEFVASMTQTGVVTLTGIIDGKLAVTVADSSSPYTSGHIAASFHGTLGYNNFIDDKTIAIDLGGSPSSSGFKAQANIVPSSVPGCYVGISSPTNPGIGLPNGLANHGGLLVAIQAGNLLFSDGTVLPFPYVTLLQTASNGGGADGIWYFSVAMVPAKLSGIYYLSQTAPTSTQLSKFYADGVIPVAFNLSMTVIAGAVQMYGINSHVRRLL